MPALRGIDDAHRDEAAQRIGHMRGAQRGTIERRLARCTPARVAA
jgi:hypothetical protein